MVAMAAHECASKPRSTTIPSVCVMSRTCVNGLAPSQLVGMQRAYLSSMWSLMRPAKIMSTMLCAVFCGAMTRICFTDGEVVLLPRGVSSYLVQKAHVLHATRCR